ncbi:MAG: DUF167 domain-containing protein [Bryobacteraceae bacterium]
MDEFFRRIANAKAPVTLAVKVVPKSARNQIAGVLPDGTLKVKIAAPPEKGQANQALCAFLAEQLNIRRAHSAGRGRWWKKTLAARCVVRDVH